jgi:hypothetical protein
MKRRSPRSRSGLVEVARDDDNSKYSRRLSEEPPEERFMAKSKKKRASWFDEESQKPMIETYARQLKSFIQTMADGKVEKKEIKDQEERLVSLMKEIEPQLEPELHEKVTQLLCELTAYDLMQTLYRMQEARPKTAFRG